MTDPKNFDLDDWLSRWDMQAVPDFDDKLRECEFFFRLLAAETDRGRFRWLLSAFLNAAYSFFESSALTAFFRFTDHEGEPVEDSEGLALLRRHVAVKQSPKNPEYVKTSGLSPLTQRLYDIRKKCTHHHPLAIMEVGPTLPEDFQVGSMRGEGVPIMPLCRDVMELIRHVHEGLR